MDAGIANIDVRRAHREHDFEVAIAVWEEEYEDGRSPCERKLIVVGWRGSVGAETREGLLSDG